MSAGLLVVLNSKASLSSEEKKIRTHQSWNCMLLLHKSQ